MDFLKELIKDNFAVFGTIFGALIGSISGWIGGYFLKRYEIICQRKDNRRMNKEKNLCEFYYPLLLLTRKNKQLYNIFRQGKDSEFRTLIELLKGTKLSSNDEVLLREIVEIDNEINELITKNKGVINEKLSEAFAKASLHFTLIKLAVDKKLIGEEQRFSDSVYPRDLEYIITKEIKRLESGRGIKWIIQSIGMKFFQNKKEENQNMTIG